MKIFPYKHVEAEDAGEGSSKLKVRWLITRDIGAPNFAMRVFEMEPGGYSPLHTHLWEHEVFVLEGEGTVVGKDEERAVVPGDVIFIAPNELHQFKNKGEMAFMFICLVPMRDK